MSSAFMILHVLEDFRCILYVLTPVCPPLGIYPASQGPRASIRVDAEEAPDGDGLAIPPPYRLLRPHCHP